MGRKDQGGALGKEEGERNEAGRERQKRYIKEEGYMKKAAAKLTKEK